MDGMGILISCAGSYIFLTWAKNETFNFNQEQLFDIFIAPQCIAFVILAIFTMLVGHIFENIVKN